MAAGGWSLVLVHRQWHGNTADSHCLHPVTTWCRLGLQAAGVIHTDFERGFIRAETVAYDDFVSCGGEKEAREAGKLRAEGKEYVVAEADILNFRFNV